ncbi:LOG family protein [Saccharothrix coeruleofusca]|uniref:Cytokinin riboside 5'-monophosphate phosphoribohydrolase n=1 Tax=Saccharothrix coeruleofusca TaxID=33919 RepID=A0A918AVD8_9PSEU|nr:TIGR00730 family Rossman fold protein [Saccharothrix coeruleofusca]MBP2336004.1 uncharacterized protein (TIGR00730 family) [Saccharothrix coeruleofusca]GGP76061.1 cytokinin riboside 5'-monophosphate phosphoribohydrolase [Saccharothrix coeruleofusca]
MDTSSPRYALCVFCGFSTGNSPRYQQVATELGQLLADRRHQLVYGAGGVGLMGAVARGAADRGGEILGVIPHFLRSREAGHHLPPQTVVLTDDLLDRKRIMIERADAFIALPGGYGTLDEVLEVVSMTALGLDVGPLVLVDVANDWATLRDLVRDLLGRGFARRHDLFHVVGSAEEALDAVESLLAPAVAVNSVG